MFNRRWFLFIEWSIGVVALVGILSAALFPSMAWYLARSRDTARISHARDIALAVNIYSADHSWPPETDSSWCIPTQLAEYIGGKIPTDPSANRYSQGCDGSNGMTYTYRKWVYSTSEYGDVQVGFIGIDMESSTSGNSQVPLTELSDEEAYQVSANRVWSGPYYIVTP
jgi:type II secretory pathway pseudopilin PulG